MVTISDKLQELIDNSNLNEINNLLQDGISGDYKSVLENENIIFLNNVLFILFYYSLLLKGLADKDELANILSYLNKGYKSLETNFFVSKVFLNTLEKSVVDITGLDNNEYLEYLFQKKDGVVYYKEGDEEKKKRTYKSEVNVAMYLFLEIFDTNLELISLSEEEIAKLIEKDETMVNVIKEINMIKYLLNKLNENNVITNLYMFNTTYINHTINKLNFNNSEDISTDIVIKINTSLNNLFKINDFIIVLLNEKGFNISTNNYKSLISINFLENYFLKIIPNDTEKVPFFKDYVQYIETEVKEIVLYYLQNNPVEIIERESGENNKIIFEVKGFNPYSEEKNKLLDLHKSLGLIKYLGFEQYIYNYITQNDIELGDINDITLLITIISEEVGTIETRIRYNVLYQLYVNNNLIFETTN